MHGLLSLGDVFSLSSYYHYPGQIHSREGTNILQIFQRLNYPETTAFHLRTQQKQTKVLKQTPNDQDNGFTSRTTKHVCIP